MKFKIWMLAVVLAAACGAKAAGESSSVDRRPVNEPESNTVTTEKIMPFARLANEVSPLRRRSVLAPNTLTLFDGVLVGYVHTSVGALSLRRRDLVGITLAPLVLDRLYDSRGEAGPDGDFGAGGWRLSLAATLRIDAGGGVYIDESGARLRVRRVGTRFMPVRPAPGRLRSLTQVDEQRVELRRFDGTTQEFERAGDTSVFRLRRSVDRFGNERRHHYDGAGRLRRVTSGSRFLAFERNRRGNIVAVRDDAARTVHYDYDAQGYLVAAIDAGGHRWHYHYDLHGRLSDVTAPGGNHDLSATYDAIGRVRSVVRQGHTTRYDYRVAAGEPDGVVVTRVVDGSRQRLFGHNAHGVTVWAQNNAGQRSRLWLGAANQPLRVDVDGQQRLALGYDDQGRVTQVTESAHGESRTRSIRYAADGRPAAIHDEDGLPLALIARDAPGEVGISGPGMDRRLAVSDAGAVIQLALDARDRLDFETSPLGQIVAVANDASAPVRFGYASAGWLSSVTFGDGVRHEYGHDALGLRTRTASSTGAVVDYFYAPEGRIYRHEMTAPDGTRQVTSHAFDAQQRLTAIRQGNAVIRLSYHNGGGLARYAPPGTELRFDYDALRRLSEVRLDDERWRYRYAPSEPGLVRQAESRRSPGVYDPRYAATELAGLYAAVYLRRMPASHGALWLDTDSGDFRLAHEFGVPLPDEELRLALRAAGLLNADFRPAVFGDEHEQQSAFNAPSSFLFVPPEYWALNCIVCPGFYPRPAPQPSVPDWPTLDAAAAAFMPACYLLPLPVPGPACSLAVSGLPQYLCMGDVADVGAWLTPGSLSSDQIRWTTNDFLQVQPAGATGSPVTMRGVPGTNPVTSGVGTVAASFSGSGVSCVSAERSMNVIAEKARNYTQLTDLDICPERQQDTDVPHSIDGCSVPPLVSDLLFAGDIQDPVGGMHHAPGHATTFGTDQGPVPFGTPVAPLPCNRHDVCYQTCGHNRRGCDNLFDDRMAAVCEQAYPHTCPYGFGTPECIAFEQEKANCLIVRTAVYQGVRVAGGPSYRQRQVQHCRCCP